MNLKFDMKRLLKRKAKTDELENLAPLSERAQKIKNLLIIIKSNILVLSLAVVSISALAFAYMFSAHLQQGNENVANEFASKIEKLSKLERTPVTITIPGNEPVTGNLTVNRKLVDAVKSRMGLEQTEGIPNTETVSKAAIQFNKGSHKPILSMRFKKEDESKRRVVRLDMHDKLTDLYNELLKKCRATLPPSEEDILVELQRAKLRFVLTDLGQTIDAKRTPEQEKKLVSELTNRRLASYRNVALASGLYLDAQDIGAPIAPLPEAPYEKIAVSLWTLQWNYWIAEDILLACAELNENESIVTAPVKRVVKMKSRIPYGATQSAESETSQFTEGNDSAAQADSVNSAGIDPNAPVSMSNYSSSFVKGWASNQLYDVVQTQVSLVVETSKIPLVTDAFAKKNFIVISNVRISSVDPFEAIRSGYVYGPNPVSLVLLQLESAWLREWTGPLMPDPVRAMLGTTGQVQSALESSGAITEIPNEPPR
ncbi:MAG: hypothetical protein O3B75_07580 [Planctomycetota bacterium]|nr:hypothetical protein [Planctomycetota bacterium]